MNNFDGFDFEGGFCSGLCQCTTIYTQIRAEVEESVKNGMEASIPRLFEEALRKLQSSIPALVEGEMKKQLLVFPSLVEEAFRTQLRASIPELALTVMKESQRMMSQVEEASRAVPAFQPSSQSSPRPLTASASPQQAESSNLHLKFEGNLPESFFTKDDIKDQGATLKVELHDQFGHKVEVGPESSAKIKIFVVNGDFKIEDGQSDEDISKHAVTPREGKPSLLKGKCEIFLSKGVASASEIAFTDNSKSMRNGMFRLGAQVINSVSTGVAIKQAVSDGFKVKEHRNTFYRRQQISLNDEVWHLVNIGKGQTLKKLENKDVHCVKDLLHLYNNDMNELLHIFRGNKKKLNETIEMAKSCAQSALPIQSQMTPDNSQKQLDEMLSEKRSEPTHFPSMTNLIAVEAEPFCSNLTMPYMTTIDPYQGEPAMQPDGFTQDSLRELGRGNSFCAVFENQGELSEFCSAFSMMPTLAENAYLPSSAVNIHLDATGADQGVTSYQSGDLTVGDYFDMSSYIEPRYRPGWPLVLAVLRFRIAVKVSAKEGPRAGKRQKLS